MHDPVKEQELEGLQRESERHLAICRRIRSRAIKVCVIVGGATHVIGAIVYYMARIPAYRTRFYTEHKSEIDSKLYASFKGYKNYLALHEPEFDYDRLNYGNIHDRVASYYASHPEKSGSLDWMTSSADHIFDMYYSDSYVPYSLLDSIISTIPAGLASAGLVALYYAFPYWENKREAHKNDERIRKLEDELFWDRRSMAQQMCFYLIR